MPLRSRTWPLATFLLAFTLIASLFFANAQPTDPPPKAVEPPRRDIPPGAGAVQPSSSVEATALAIAYHALRHGDAKVTPQAVGQFAAEMMNAFSAARK